MYHIRIATVSPCMENINSSPQTQGQSKVSRPEHKTCERETKIYKETEDEPHAFSTEIKQHSLPNMKQTISDIRPHNYREKRQY